jgi:hypothetical protein
VFAENGRWLDEESTPPVSPLDGKEVPGSRFKVPGEKRRSINGHACIR